MFMIYAFLLADKFPSLKKLVADRGTDEQAFKKTYEAITNWEKKAGVVVEALKVVRGRGMVGEEVVIVISRVEDMIAVKRVRRPVEISLVLAKRCESEYGETPVGVFEDDCDD